MLTHEQIEKNVGWLIILTVLVVSFGGLVEIVPLFYIKNTIEKVEGIRPYSPLELAGYNIYVREGCYTCHSQMIRPLRDEVERYGHYSLAAESMYDHPFQWGSKRNGPDLARVGGKYSNDWQRDHLRSPRSMVPTSIMPGYPFLAETRLDGAHLAEQMRMLRVVGVPYTDAQLENAAADLTAQRKEHLALFNLLGDPLLRIRSGERVEVDVPGEAAAGEGTVAGEGALQKRVPGKAPPTGAAAERSDHLGILAALHVLLE